MIAEKRRYSSHIRVLQKKKIQTPPENVSEIPKTTP
jgi:hypothetical protein